MKDYPIVKAGETLEAYRARIGVCPRCGAGSNKCECSQVGSGKSPGSGGKPCRPAPKLKRT